MTTILAAAIFLIDVAHAAQVKVDAPRIPGFSDVVAAVAPAVVSVRVRAGPPHSAPGESGARSTQAGPGAPLAGWLKSLAGEAAGIGSSDIRPVSQASGFFVTGDGYVVTDNDVISGGDTFQVILNDGTSYPARLIGQDPRTDIAVLKADTPKRELSYLGFADDSKVRVGDWIVTVGNPNGLGGTVTAGIISGHGRDVGAAPFDDFIQFNAPVTAGDVGGPAFNLSGEVVGMNAALFSSNGGMGVAFAIPASVVERVAHELIRNGSVRRGWLGVSLQTVTPDIADSVGLSDTHGALVANVATDAPARAADIRAGNVITSIDGRTVRSPGDLARAVNDRKPGDAVELGLWGDGKARTVTVKLGHVPAPHPQAGSDAPSGLQSPTAHSPLARFGLTVTPADNDRGVLITDVQPDSPADQRNLHPGDIVVSVNGSSVKSSDDVLDAIASAVKQKRRAVLFRIEDGTSSHFVALPIDTG